MGLYKRSGQAAWFDISFEAKLSCLSSCTFLFWLFIILSRSCEILFVGPHNPTQFPFVRFFGLCMYQWWNFALVESKKCVMCGIVVLFVSSIKRKRYSRMHNLSMWYFSMLHKSSFYYPIWMIFNHYAVQSWFKGVKLTFFFGGGHFSSSTLKRSLFRFKRNLNLNYLFIHPFWCSFLSWFTYWIIWLYSFICKSISI